MCTAHQNNVKINSAITVLSLQNKFLWCQEENKFLRSTQENRVLWWMNLSDDIELIVFPSWFPHAHTSLSLTPWNESNLVLSRSSVKAIAQRFCPILTYSLFQHAASTAYISSCSPLLGCSIQVLSWNLRVESAWPGTMWLLSPHGLQREDTWVHEASAGHKQEKEGFCPHWITLS